MEKLNNQALELLREVQEDYNRVGTNEYKGIAFFWSGIYKHTLRNCSREERVLVHNKWMNAGLELNGHSEEHQYYIDEVKTDLMLQSLLK